MSFAESHFGMMAAYNARANTILYDAVAKLSDAEYLKERQAFFSSIQGTLNHLMVGDTIWMTRFEGGDITSANLGALPHPEFEDLRRARTAMDDRVSRFMGERLDEAFLDGTIDYINNAGVACSDPIRVLLPHFFNHQTHHRGQVHGMLSQTDVPPPSLDLHRVVL